MKNIYKTNEKIREKIRDINLVEKMMKDSWLQHRWNMVFFQ